MTRSTCTQTQCYAGNKIRNKNPKHTQKNIQITVNCKNIAPQMSRRRCSEVCNEQTSSFRKCKSLFYSRTITNNGDHKVGGKIPPQP